MERYPNPVPVVHPGILEVLPMAKQVQIGNDLEKAQSERISHSNNRGGKNYIDN